MSRFGRLLVGAASLALLAAACGRGSGSSDGEQVGAGAYIAALGLFLPPAPPPPPPSDERAVVFVAPIAGRALPLAVQIEVVGAFADTYDIRFVDDADAAIDERAPDDPPQEGGLLIGIGPVTTEAPHSTRVEVYWNHDHIEGHLLALTVDDGGWHVSRDEPVRPEVLSRRG